MFTQGNLRSYESLMQKKPRHNKNSGSNTYSSPQFKYRYKDFACDHCLHHRACTLRLCPYIMDNLDDLMGDESFINALENAEAYRGKHRRTLIYLKTEVWTE